MTTDMHKSDPPPVLIPKTTSTAWFVGPAFLLLAGGIALFGHTPEIPTAETPEFSPTNLVASTRPTVTSDPPITTIGSYEYRCNDCHDVFQSPTEKTGDLYQHLDIHFDHGINNSCYNCHDQKNRDELVGRNGQYISYTDIPLLCSQCHGPTYRDWERGMHGKTLGSWETGSPDQVRLECSQCHDPHAPAFPDYQPLPGPNTLRMGNPPAELHHESPSPLAIPFQNKHKGEHSGEHEDDTTGTNGSDQTTEGGADH